MDKIQPSDYKAFVKEIKEKSYQVQLKAMQAVNRELLSLYSGIGKSIVDKQEQLGWGKSALRILPRICKKSSRACRGSLPGIFGSCGRFILSIRTI